MDSNKANLDDVSKPFLIQNQIKSLLISSKYSDVSFLVEGEVIHAHKSILSMGSPVFEKMFYGDLKMGTSKPIEIIDMSAIGFKNMLKYIYANKIEFELQYFYETYLEADKYLVYHMTDALIDYLILKLNESNCCFIYDQLMKIQYVNLLQLDKVKKFIIDNTEKAFESDYFIKLSPIILIHLLNLEQLNISELDLLKAIWRYVNANVNAFENDTTKESKRKLFEQFKNFIRFAKIDPNDLAKFEHIDDLLTKEEIGLLLFHLLNPKIPLNIKCLTKRIDGQIYSVSFDCIHDVKCCSKRIVTLNLNQKVNVKIIHTSVKTEFEDLNLIIRSAQDTDLKLKIEKFVQNGKWSFKFKCFPVLELTDYKLEFQMNGEKVLNMSSRTTKEFNINQKKLIFQLKLQYKQHYHFIEKIDFSIPYNGTICS